MKFIQNTMREKRETEIFYDFKSNFDHPHYFGSDNRALFLDRDGVIIKDVNYISNPEDVELEIGVIELLNKAYEHKLPVFIVTNQSGISRGFYKWDDFHKVNEKIIELIGQPNPIYSIYANSHIETSTDNWRKPNPNMIFKIANRFNLNLKRSILIGDRISDLQAGIRSGIRKLIHVETGHGEKEKQKILESIDKDGYFNDSKLKSELILLKNLNKFPLKLFELFEC